MAGTLTWGGTALPQPDAEGGVDVSAARIGAARRALDGGALVDHVVTKRTVRLRWSDLTQVELDGIISAITNKGGAANTLALPDGRSLSVILPTGAGLRDGTATWAGGVTPVYTADLELWEV